MAPWHESARPGVAACVGRGMVLRRLGRGRLGVALDLDALWDHDQPALTEQRLRAALAAARGDDALVLRTQIARTFSLRRRFEDAHRELDALEPVLGTAGPEPRVHALLYAARGDTQRAAHYKALHDQAGAAR